MSEQPVILAIESTQREGGVALRDRQGLIHVERMKSDSKGRRHSEALMVLIDHVVTGLARLKPRDVQAIAVSIGPGGFTGVRIGITTAKILGETLGATIAAVPTALVAAESRALSRQQSTTNPTPNSCLGVALASKDNQVWWTQLIRDRNVAEWSIRGQPSIQQAHSIDLSDIGVVLADRFFPESGRAHCAAHGIEVESPQFLPEACLSAGSRLLARGETTDPIRLAPIYAREPEAVRLWTVRGAR